MTASTAGAGWAVSSDIGALVEALSTVGAGLDPIIVAAPKEFGGLHTWTSEATKFYPTFASAALPTGDIVAIERSSFVSAYDPVPEFQIATAGVLSYDDSTPASDPLTQSPARSLFQTDVVGMRMLLRVAWGLRNSQHVAHLTGASW